MNEPKKGFDLADFLEVITKNLRLCRNFLNGDWDGLMANVSPSRYGRDPYLATLREIQTAVEAIESALRNLHILFDKEC